MAIAEDEIIERYFAGPAAPDVIVGIGDDGAVTSLPAGHAVVSAVATMTAAGPDGGYEGGARLARSAAAAALERLERAGGSARWLTLALTLPAVDEAWLEGFSAALTTTAAEHGAILVGGDTTRGPLAVTVAATGPSAAPAA